MVQDITQCSAVEQAFNISEILCSIFRLLVDTTKPGVGRLGNLPACARVCKSWQDPACAIIWGAIPDTNTLGWLGISQLANLVGLQGKVGDKKDAAYVTDISRLLHYSKWIRSLHISNTKPFDEQDVLILRDACTLNKKRPICPTIQSLHVSVYSDCSRDLPLMVMGLYGRELQHLELGVYFGAQFLSHYLMQDMIVSCPELERLRITGITNWTPLQRNALDGMLQHLPALATVKLEPEMIDRKLLLLLARIPSLLNLDLDARSSSSNPRIDWGSPEDSLSDPSVNFMHLSSLRVSGDPVQCHSLLVAFFANSPLRELKINVLSQSWHQSRMPCLADCIPTLVQNLTSFEMRVFHSNQSSVLAEWPTFTLRPLHALKECATLKQFSLYYSGKFEVADSELVDLTRCWPDLTHLTIASTTLPGKLSATKSLTYAVISAMVDSNPCITHLVLTILRYSSISVQSRRPWPNLKLLQLLDSLYPPITPLEITALAIYFGAYTPLDCEVSFYPRCTMDDFIPEYYTMAEFEDLLEIRVKAVEDLEEKLDIFRMGRRAQKALTEDGDVPMEFLPTNN